MLLKRKSALLCVTCPMLLITKPDLISLNGVISYLKANISQKKLLEEQASQNKKENIFYIALILCLSLKPSKHTKQMEAVPIANPMLILQSYQY